MKNAFCLLFAGVLITGCTATSGAVHSSVQQLSMESGTNRTITEADAASIAHTLNDGEIATAQLALTKASAQQVRDFAQMLITDHEAANASLEKLGFGRFKNLVTDALTKDVARRTAELEKLSGEDFDRAFIRHQVELHETALELIRGTLQLSASSKALRDAFSTARTSVEMHLKQARSM